MAGVRSLFNGFFLLLLHLGCFFSSSNPNPNPNPNTDPTLDEHTQTPKRRKISPVSSSPSSSDTALNNTRKHSSLSLSLSIRFRSHVNRLFSFRNKDPHSHPPAQPISPPSPLHPSLPLSPDNDAIGGSISSEPATKRGSFSARTDIYPCPACGEVLTKAHLLDLHQATKHALSDLRDGDSGRNIVSIIFHSGWIGGNPPVIHRILKIHHSPRTLARFEEYREDVRSRGRGEDERCIADGNERLRFYCSTVMCALGRRDGHGPGPPGACGAQFCSTCAIVRHGFSGKQAELGGIATHGTSWDAHVSLPEDLEREFAFLQVRRAMLVCRVIAGHVARCGAAEEKGAVWDSVVPLRRGGGPRSSWAEDEELLVFSPRAVLPCFIIVYNS